jgi:hypothetical protein
MLFPAVGGGGDPNALDAMTGDVNWFCGGGEATCKGGATGDMNWFRGGGDMTRVAGPDDVATGEVMDSSTPADISKSSKFSTFDFVVA